MLSLDGAEHARHRAPFVAPFRLGEVRRRLADAVRGGGRAAGRRAGAARRGGAAARLRRAAGRGGRSPTRSGSTAPRPARCSAGTTRSWPPSPTSAPAGPRAGRQAALAPSRSSARRSTSTPPARWRRAEVRSNAAVLLFGGIETTEGMIVNALAARAGVRPARARAGDALPAAVEESLRLEPAAAVIDRYATRDVELGGAEIARGRPGADLDRRRQPRPGDVFPDPDRFDPGRENAGRQLAFAAARTCAWGCTSRGWRRTSRWHAARAAARAASSARPAEPRGLVFRKPPELWCRWAAS